MQQRILTISVNAVGQTVQEEETLKFRKGRFDLIGDGIGLSASTNCDSVTFVEMPAGFVSDDRIVDRTQLVVCMMGELHLKTADGATAHLRAGDIFKVSPGEGLSYTMTVPQSGAFRAIVAM